MKRPTRPRSSAETPGCRIRAHQREPRPGQERHRHRRRRRRTPAARQRACPQHRASPGRAEAPPARTSRWNTSAPRPRRTAPRERGAARAACGQAAGAAPPAPAAPAADRGTSRRPSPRTLALGAPSAPPRQARTTRCAPLQVGEKPPGDQVEQGDARRCAPAASVDGRRDAVPAGRHHQVERQIAERVQVALRAGGEEILLQPAGEQLERQVIVVVEQVPVEVLAREHGPGCAQRRRQDEDRTARRASTPALRTGQL